MSMVDEDRADRPTKLFQELLKRAEDKAAAIIAAGSGEAAARDDDLVWLEELLHVQLHLVESHARYFDLYHLAPVGYITVDEQNFIRESNLRAAAIIGVSHSALGGTNFCKWISGGDEDGYHLTRGRLLETDGPQACELTLIRVDGSSFWARLEMSLAQDDAVRVCRIVITDMSERKAAERLREANVQLTAEKKAAEQATEAKGQFLSAISHDFRTPLAAIIGMTDLLLDTSLTKEQSDYAQTVAASAEALLAMVNDILDLSKIEAGKLELDAAPFDLERLIEDVLGLMSFRAREKSLELACWYAPGAQRRFLGDAARLRQVFTNLLSNAIKFTHSGHVLVDVTTSEPDGGWSIVRIAIHDTGIGIAQDKLSRLFTRFSQADATIARRFGGTGLGLSIVKQIIELMGGAVGVSSAEDEGSVFHCEVPLRIVEG